MKKFYKKINWLIILIYIFASFILFSIYLLLPNTNISLFFSSLIPNFVAVLIGFIVAYYFFKLLGMSQNDELKQDIRDIITENGKIKFETEGNINNIFSFQEHLKTAKTIDVISLSAYNLISEHRTELTSAIIRGCTIRVLIVQPNSVASNLGSNWQENKELDKDLERVKDRFKQIKNDINNNSKTKGILEVKGINWIPSCALIIIDNKKTTATMRLKVYPLIIDLPLNQIDTHMIINKNNQTGLFENFANQFEELWNKSTSIETIKKT